MVWGTSTLRTLANEDLGTLAEYDPLTGYEANDYHISETTEQNIQESSGEKRSLNSHDLEYDDYTIGIALSSPLFTQEREDAASRRQACHSLDEGLSSSLSYNFNHSMLMSCIPSMLIPCEITCFLFQMLLQLTIQINPCVMWCFFWTDHLFVRNKISLIVTFTFLSCDKSNP